jgi:hypothetical protein
MPSGSGIAGPPEVDDALRQALALEERARHVDERVAVGGEADEPRPDHDEDQRGPRGDAHAVRPGSAVDVGHEAPT